MERPVDKRLIVMAIVTLSLTTPAWAQSGSNLISAPIIQKNTKTFTIIKVGDNGPPARVTLDTGSSMLVLEQKFVKNYYSNQSNDDY